MSGFYAKNRRYHGNPHFSPPPPSCTSQARARNETSNNPIQPTCSISFMNCFKFQATNPMISCFCFTVWLQLTFICLFVFCSFLQRQTWPRSKRKSSESLVVLLLVTVAKRIDSLFNTVFKKEIIVLRKKPNINRISLPDSRPDRSSKQFSNVQ